MTTLIKKLEDLPRRTVRQARTRWRHFVRYVHVAGAVAVGDRQSETELVFVDAKRYRAMLAIAQQLPRKGGQ